MYLKKFMDFQIQTLPTMSLKFFWSQFSCPDFFRSNVFFDQTIQSKKSLDPNLFWAFFFGSIISVSYQKLLFLFFRCKGLIYLDYNNYLSNIQTGYTICYFIDMPFYFTYWLWTLVWVRTEQAGYMYNGEIWLEEIIGNNQS